MADEHILLLGAPGAGKGTQSKRLAAEYDLAHVSTGDALRANKDMETPHGTPREYMEEGDLVPDEVVNEVLAEALNSADGYVLDGYPRNKEQVEYLDGVTDLDYVLFLDVDEDELVGRLTGRRVCSECGATYHVEFDQPEEPGVCDECGGELVQRDDDAEDTVRDRLGVYRESTEPVIEHYRDEGVLVEVDGQGTPDEVFSRIQDAIEGDE